MTPGEEAPTTWERWYTLATTFVAPATFVSALLFYFGYVSSRAEYRYFGLDVDTIGLGTQDFVMRSPQALLVPALLLILLGAAASVALGALGRRDLSGTGVRRVALVGGGVTGLGAALVIGYPWLGSWDLYPMLTPLVLAAGLGVLAVAVHRTRISGTALALLVLAVVLCVFWATATLAQWTGLGVAHRTARHLDDLPAVVLDTHERLYLTDGVVTETRLPVAEGQEFTYRYRGLRLLIQGGDRLFLVPERWAPSDSTLVVDLDDVRMRFRFVDDQP